MGIPPFQLEDYIQVQSNSNKPSNLANEKFAHGHGLVIGIAHYANINNLPNAVLNDARELRLLLENSAGYTASNIISLLDDNATRTAIRAAFDELALRTEVDDTVIIFYSGHGAHNSSDTKSQYILPYDWTLNDLEHTCISGEELTTLISNIRANRVLVILDSCHSGGIGNPKDLKLNSYIKGHLSEDYYAVASSGQRPCYYCIFTF